MYSNNAGFKRHALNSWRIVRSVKDHICNPLKENFKAYASLLSQKLLALPLLELVSSLLRSDLEEHSGAFAIFVICGGFFLLSMS